MADGDDRAVLEQMVARDAEMRRERERQRRADTMGASMGHFGSSLREAIEAAAAVATATEDDIRAMETRLAYEGRKERMARSGVKSVLRAEDRKRLLDGTLDQTHALAVTQDWLALAMRPREPGPNTLVLCGHPGTGKTVAAAWALSMMGGRYVTTEEYLRGYYRWTRDVMRDDATSREMDRFEARGLLVLDELGTERDATLMRDGLHRLIDRRQTRRGQLTIIVTNLTREVLRQRMQDGTYDPRTYDRMKRDAKVIGVRGDSMRKGAW